MSQTADVRGCVAQLAWLPAHVRDEVSDAVDRHAGMHDQGKRICSDDADRREILNRIVVDLGHCGNDRDLRQRRQQERMAVRRRPCHCLRGKGTAGTRSVLDDELRTIGVAEALGDDASYSVAAPTRRERNDDPNRLLRPSLCMRRWGKAVGGKDGKQSQQHSACTHECLPANSRSASRGYYHTP